jgi:hypothetical protein
MKIKLAVVLLVLISLLSTGFYFWADLQKIYQGLIGQLSDDKKIFIDSLIGKVEQQILAPPPLRSLKEANQATLSEDGIINWTNQQRAFNGLPALAENTKLVQAALTKAQDMLKNQYFEHVSPSGTGPSELADNAGYDFIAIGENLALGNFAGDQDLVQAWMDSPGHRANILNSRYREIGVAAIRGVFEGKRVWLAVQEFGLPLSACPAVDELLKIQIDNGKAGLEELAALLEARLAELEDTSKRDSIYNSKVSAYNDLARQYNALADGVKAQVNNYNQEVRLFNACINQ